MTGGWFIETAGFRLSPSWFPEAGPFESEAAAREWLTGNRHKLIGLDREVRIVWSEES